MTITIPAELEDKIAERAAAKGVTLEEYAQEVLERAAEMPTLRELFAPVRDPIKAAGVTDEELSAQNRRGGCEGEDATSWLNH